MRKLLVIGVALGASLVVMSPAFAVDDQNCSDFESQAAAQAHLRADPSDPDGLDGSPGRNAGDDGVACENNSGPRDEVSVYAQEQTSTTTVTSPPPSAVTQTTPTSLRVQRSDSLAGTGPITEMWLALCGATLVAAGIGARRRAGDARPAGDHWLR